MHFFYPSYSFDTYATHNVVSFFTYILHNYITVLKKLYKITDAKHKINEYRFQLTTNHSIKRELLVNLYEKCMNLKNKFPYKMAYFGLL